MQTNCVALEPTAWRRDALLVFLFEDAAPAELLADVALAAPWLPGSQGLADLKGAAGEAVVYGPDTERVVAVGLGAVADFSLAGFRKAAGAAARRSAALGLNSLGVSAAHLRALAGWAVRGNAPCGGEIGTAADTPGPEALAAKLAEETAFVVASALYRFDRFRSKEEKPQPGELTLLFGADLDELLAGAARRGASLAAGVALARDLANGPGNVVNPEYLAEAARRLAERHSMECLVLERAEMEALGMGALLAVASGAGFEPRLIVLEHRPPGTESDAPRVLVGKGITFDSGGISLKPAQGMANQTTDMSGAAAVLGALDALARESVQRRVIGILPCTENMPGSAAARPGDIVTALSGATIEIVNTDAEGRLLLCDALTYAQREYKPALLVDIATLTGACVVALGERGAGLFTPSSKLSHRLHAIGKANGEHLWPMPLWPEYKEQLSSGSADLANAGKREGGAITAAIFLQHFITPGTLWAHLDIAAPARQDSPDAIGPKGATGFGVRSLFELIRTWE